jgi:hypothetical protein
MLRRNKMCKKLLLVRYLGYTPEGDLATVAKKYAYTVETRKSIKNGDFVVLADKNGNADRNIVSTVRVISVLDGNISDDEKEKALSDCGNCTREKIFVGKAELGDFFAELDKKRKREALMHKIEVRFKEAEKEALYRKLAETDPEMRALLSELDSLN